LPTLTATFLPGQMRCRNGKSFSISCICKALFDVQMMTFLPSAMQTAA
jgi:hypothetical protein